PAVVKMPCLLLCSTASRMRAFVLKAGKERVMIKELANEHKRALAPLNTTSGQARRNRKSFVEFEPDVAIGRHSCRAWSEQ
ncbi:hypothetical protein, partial [Rhizobium leguminosarum]|uniref:hypothetical protein n=4 Tax=Rhizobium leguminosarum TaxID=384 RepID=UPI001C9462D8